MRWRALQTERVYVQQNPDDAQLSTEDTTFSNCVHHCTSLCFKFVRNPSLLDTATKETNSNGR